MTSRMMKTGCQLSPRPLALGDVRESIDLGRIGESCIPTGTGKYLALRWTDCTVSLCTAQACRTYLVEAGGKEDGSELDERHAYQESHSLLISFEPFLAKKSLTSNSQVFE